MTVWSWLYFVPLKYVSETPSIRSFYNSQISLQVVKRPILKLPNTQKNFLNLGPILRPYSTTHPFVHTSHFRNSKLDQPGTPFHEHIVRTIVPFMDHTYPSQTTLILGQIFTSLVPTHEPCHGLNYKSQIWFVHFPLQIFKFPFFLTFSYFLTWGALQCVLSNMVDIQAIFSPPWIHFLTSFLLKYLAPPSAEYITTVGTNSPLANAK